MKNKLIIFLIAIGFICVINANAQIPTITFEPNSNGEITFSEVNNKLNDHFGGGNTTSNNPNRWKEFIAEFGAGVTNIGNSAFSACTSLVNIVLPNSLTSIDDLAFFLCISLKQIILPNNLASIGNSAFNTCESLTTITLPNSLTNIGDRAFFLCNSLELVNALRPTPPELENDVFRFIHPDAILCVIDDMAVEVYTDSDWNQYFSEIKVCTDGINEYIPTAIKIFPNPVSSSFFLSFDLERSCDLHITLSDISGTELMELYSGFSVAGLFSRTINTEHLASGVYFVKVSIGGESVVEKIVVE